ncbi:hypothetical protein B4100_3792 [Heyndrickxia coagulans]|nr:hypothetical protein B4100_3792 [Heyndrickxia coagulans]
MPGLNSLRKKSIPDLSANAILYLPDSNPFFSIAVIPGSP